MHTNVIINRLLNLTIDLMKLSVCQLHASIIEISGRDEMNILTHSASRKLQTFSSANKFNNKLSLYIHNLAVVNA